MSLTVYGAPLSPFVRKLRLCLIEKGLEYDLQMIVPHDQPDWYHELNPLRRIPALKDDDLTLADSSVICQYLEDRYPDLPPLYGNDPVETARIRWLEKYADYELAPLTTFCIFRNRVLKPTMGKACDEDAIRDAQDKLPAHFDYLEGALGDAPYFTGETLSMADLAIVSQLINMEHGGERLDEGRWPNLAALYQRIKGRPSVQSVLPGEQRTLSKLSALATR